MIDIHCHILPGVDDGAQNAEDSLNMAKAAADEGIETIIATPHHQNGTYINTSKEIRDGVRYLNDLLQASEIPVTILPGQETRINGDMIEQLEQGQLLPLNETSGYIFVELPHDHVPRYTSQLLFDIQVSGYQAIIVHPERNRELMQNPDQLYKFVKDGALTQVTAASVCGKFGKKIQKFTSQLIESNLTHFIASDAHNTTNRGFHLREAYDVIEEEYGIDWTYFFMENTEYLKEGQTVAKDIPVRVKRRKFLGLF
ncbi:tyrosine-protein phosphatase [Pontibacillus marinus]|uniref:Tyrosine-protein phosphatase n=1 Tax=Pontibacillus marinus BH030004 = DSM 16465 TaxID=1385511 RepID=A0A0A5I5A2_9BACI|nr:CpsB/CapC family capsule biosynthesis tyrosine phosphatase [Pontibacillus marinus]KGX90987.1 tyrosine protein phosphatase [Pontibacillus marinus BH030004 = DSM 16465]